MKGRQVGRVNQQSKGETPLRSGVLQRAAVRAVAGKEVEATEDVESGRLRESRFRHDFSQVGIDRGGLSKEVSKTSNQTGLPNDLKAGVENLSGYSLDDVRVHYNSPKPAQLQALAYTQGTEIHVAPGQEEHLPHEAWHVVQQMQGRVKPTMQMKEVRINEEEGLERESDVMGSKALQIKDVQIKDDEGLEREANVMRRKEERSKKVFRSFIGKEKVIQLTLNAEDESLLGEWEGEIIEKYPLVTAEEKKKIHMWAVSDYEDLKKAKEFFEHCCQKLTMQTKERYGEILKIMQVGFVDGCGKKRNNLSEVLVNLLLVRQGIRPAFLLQWVDYKNEDRKKIVSIFDSVVHDFFEDGTFTTKLIDQGLLVIDTLKVKWVKDLVNEYKNKEEGEEKEKALGMALGYPAAGEIQTAKEERYEAHIHTKDGGDIMSNVCNSVDSVARFKNFYEEVRKVVKEGLGIDLLFSVT